MPICKYCGEEFDLTYTRKRIGKLYGANSYDDYFEDSDVCDHCAIEEMSAAYNIGAEEKELMSSGWDMD